MIEGYSNIFKVKNPSTGQMESVPALRGESAYEIAVRRGLFVGTEEQWAGQNIIDRETIVKQLQYDATLTVNRAIASIPSDYTALNNQVNGIHNAAQSAIMSMEMDHEVVTGTSSLEIIPKDVSFLTINKLGPTDSAITILGKNLFDYQTIVKGYFASTPYSITSDPRYRTVRIYDCAAGTYTFSTDLEGCHILRYAIDDRITPVGLMQQSITITITSKAAIRLCFRKLDSSEIATDFHVMVERGEFATDYADYKPAYTIPTADLISKYYSNGMNTIGDVCDYFDFENKYAVHNIRNLTVADNPGKDAIRDDEAVLFQRIPVEPGGTIIFSQSEDIYHEVAYERSPVKEIKESIHDIYTKVTPNYHMTAMYRALLKWIGMVAVNPRGMCYHNGSFYVAMAKDTTAKSSVVRFQHPHDFDAGQIFLPTTIGQGLDMTGFGSSIYVASGTNVIYVLDATRPFDKSTITVEDDTIVQGIEYHDGYLYIRDGADIYRYEFDGQIRGDKEFYHHINVDGENSLFDKYGYTMKAGRAICFAGDTLLALYDACAEDNVPNKSFLVCIDEKHHETALLLDLIKGNDSAGLAYHDGMLYISTVSTDYFGLNEYTQNYNGGTQYNKIQSDKNLATVLGIGNWYASSDVVATLRGTPVTTEFTLTNELYGDNILQTVKCIDESGYHEYHRVVTPDGSLNWL